MGSQASQALHAVIDFEFTFCYSGGFNNRWGTLMSDKKLGRIDLNKVLAKEAKKAIEKSVKHELITNRMLVDAINSNMELKAFIKGVVTEVVKELYADRDNFKKKLMEDIRQSLSGAVSEIIKSSLGEINPLSDEEVKQAVTDFKEAAKTPVSISTKYGSPVTD